MEITGASYVRSPSKQGECSAKMVFNERGAVIFPVSQEHRTAKALGISYEDDGKGNALAAMLKSGRIEIRYHSGFSDDRVQTLASRLLACEELAFMRGWIVTYQGRTLRVG